MKPDDGVHQVAPAGRALSAPPPHDDGGEGTNYYALDNEIALQRHPNNPNGTYLAQASSKKQLDLKNDKSNCDAIIRVDLNSFVPPYLESGRHVEGFVVSKHCCAPRHHLYHRFVDFPDWVSNSNKPLQDHSSLLLLSSVDEEVWTDFCQSLSKDLRVGNRNLLLFKCISTAVGITLAIMLADKIDPLLLFIALVVVYVIVHECLRPSLFDRIDRVAARFQTRFAEKGIRVSVVYYSQRRGKLTSHSRYVVFTALPHDRTQNIV